MDLSIVLLILGGLLCFSLIVGFVVCFCVWIFSKREQNAALEAEKEETNRILKVEEQKTNRILKVEEQKTERARLSNEKTAIYARRDLVNAEIEAGLLSKREEEPAEEEGLDLGQIASMVLPLLQKNPEFLGSFLGRGNNAPAVPDMEQGVDSASSSFPI